MMFLSKNGEQLIKGFEQLRLNAYLDSVGVPTIGYGSTRYADGKPIGIKDRLADEDTADRLFSYTIRDYESAVNQYVKVPITQNQFDALTSFTYNEGTGALHASTLLKLLNSKDYIGAAKEFVKWNKITIKGQKVPAAGLTNRRQAEAKLFMTP